MLALRSSWIVSRSALVPRATARAVALAVLSIAAVTACKEAAEPARAFSITGMNATDSVRLGNTHAFVVELRDESGNKVTGRRITWTSLNPTIAAVDANGVVTGVALGNTNITARVDDATATTLVTVQPAVTKLVLLPPTSTVAVSNQRTLTVAMTDKDGQTVAGRAVTFSSSNPSIATVNSSGVVVGVAVGVATITAQSLLDVVSGSANVTVVPVAVTNVSISPAGAQTVFQGLTLQLSATTRDANGAILTGRPVNWTTSNQAAATVSSNGLVTGVGLGQAQITAESEGAIAAVTVTVSPRPVASIALTPNPASVKIGTSLQLSLDLRDASGNQLNTIGRSVFWDSSNKPVATVQDGVVTGVSVGSATITVTVDGQPASALVNVTPP